MYGNVREAAMDDQGDECKAWSAQEKTCMRSDLDILDLQGQSFSSGGN